MQRLTLIGAWSVFSVAVLVSPVIRAGIGGTSTVRASNVGTVQKSSSMRIQKTSGGLRLRLTMPRGPFPRNAVVPVTLAIQNVSHRSMQLCGPCGLGVEILKSRGEVVYPPAVPVLATATGKPGSRPAPMLRPGEVSRIQSYVILRARTIQAYFLASGWSLRTKVVRFTLLLTTYTPVLTLATTQPVSVSVSSAGTHHGPLLYDYSYKCQDGDGVTIGGDSGGSSWLRSTTTQIDPEVSVCDKLLEFHMVAGWANSPVGTVDYTTQ